MNGELILAVEWEFEGNGRSPLPYYFLSPLGYRPEHDGSVAVEYTATCFEWQERYKHVEAIEKILKYKNENIYALNVYIGSNCGSHIHVNYPERNFEDKIALTLIAVYLQEYHPALVIKLCGREFNNYAERINAQTITYKYNWMRFHLSLIHI